MFSLLKLVLVLKDMGIHTSLFPITYDSLINRARNAATAHFMSDPDHTHMLFIDSDIEFKINDIIELLKQDKDIIGIGYAQKWLNQKKMKHVLSNNPDIENILELSTNSSIHLKDDDFVLENIKEVEYCTTGCLLIKRQVIEKMIDKYPERKYKNDVDGYTGCNQEMFYNLFSVEINPITKRYESEDYCFCRLWKEIGGKIHVYMNASLNHWGWFSYPNNMYRQMELFKK
jgi:hypothetical protein